MQIVDEILMVLRNDDNDMGDAMWLFEKLVDEYEELMEDGEGTIEGLEWVVQRKLHEYMETCSVVDAGDDKEEMVEEMVELTEMLVKK